VIADTIDNDVVCATRSWLEGVVLKFNLCPFAHKPWRDGGVRIVACLASSEDEILEDLCSEVNALLKLKPEERETTVVAVSGLLRDFESYLDFVDLANSLLLANDWEGKIQIASFHPDYVFADSGAEDRSNYTNRAPYALLHLIRENSISQAVESHPDIDSIPQRNINLLESMGQEQFEEILKLSLAK